MRKKVKELKSSSFAFCIQKKIINLISVEQFQNWKFEKVSFYPKGFATFSLKQVIQPKPAAENFIALYVKGGTMLVFARLKMLVVIKVLMIIEILQGMVLPILINKIMTKRKLQQYPKILLASSIREVQRGRITRTESRRKGRRKSKVTTVI